MGKNFKGGIIHRGIQSGANEWHQFFHPWTGNVHEDGGMRTKKVGKVSLRHLGLLPHCDKTMNLPNL